MRAPALILAAALAAPLAHAETFAFTGSGMQSFNWWACGCFRDPEVVTWSGTLTVDASNVDGAYSGVSWLLTSNVLHAASSQPWTLADITVRDGHVVDIESEYAIAGMPSLSFRGMTASYINNAHHANSIYASARFVPDVPITPVPEPETWALMLAGLGMCGWLARRARS